MCICAQNAAWILAFSSCMHVHKHVHELHQQDALLMSANFILLQLPNICNFQDLNYTIIIKRIQPSHDTITGDIVIDPKTVRGHNNMWYHDLMYACSGMYTEEQNAVMCYVIATWMSMNMLSTVRSDVLMSVPESTEAKIDVSPTLSWSINS